jgi:hypothetical protein
MKVYDIDAFVEKQSADDEGHFVGLTAIGGHELFPFLKRRAEGR